MNRRPVLFVLVAVLVVLAASAVVVRRQGEGDSGAGAENGAGGPQGIHKIKHIVVIMQENRSFDSYFGTFPGANGIPMANGKPTACSPNPDTGACIEPFHDAASVNGGGPHGAASFRDAVNAGKMDGFVRLEVDGRKIKECRNNVQNPACTNSSSPDVMGWHDAREIPNYWAYAKNFVLQDAMFEPVATWSLPAHLQMVSGWSAKCSQPKDVSTCSPVGEPAQPPDYHPFDPKAARGPTPEYPWTDVTYMLHNKGVSWAYYITPGSQPDCAQSDTVTCLQQPHQAPGTPGIWNVLPWFATVRADKELGNIQPTANLLKAATDGTLAAVSWVTPDQILSEHPPADIRDGQGYVTNIINKLMQGPDWNSTAIFLSWDDWGGFYDHVVPPVIDSAGYGLRVPGLVISPYAKRSYIDHQTLSHDAYLKFIEDVFLESKRIDPATDGRPDPRPDIRENSPQLGDLSKDFDFNQAPKPPLLLELRPAPGVASIPGT